MARSGHPDSAGSQFFIMVDAAPHLDGQYAAFGRITDNAEAAVEVSRVPRSMMNDKPKKPQVIASIRVDTRARSTRSRRRSRRLLLEGRVRCEAENGEKAKLSAGEKVTLEEDGSLTVTPLTAQDIPESSGRKLRRRRSWRSGWR